MVKKKNSAPKKVFNFRNYRLRSRRNTKWSIRLPIYIRIPRLTQRRNDEFFSR